MNSDNDTGIERKNKKKKITSILDFDKITGLNKKDDNITEEKLQSAVLEV